MPRGCHSGAIPEAPIGIAINEVLSPIAADMVGPEMGARTSVLRAIATGVTLSSVRLRKGAGRGTPTLVLVPAPLDGRIRPNRGRPTAGIARSQSQTRSAVSQLRATELLVLSRDRNGAIVKCTLRPQTGAGFRCTGDGSERRRAVHAMAARQSTRALILSFTCAVPS
jgi:hypothetical protein